MRDYKPITYTHSRQHIIYGLPQHKTQQYNTRRFGLDATQMHVLDEQFKHDLSLSPKILAGMI